MAQTEDTELLDIALEALEKNGSLARIRALLRANVFLALEEECGAGGGGNPALDALLAAPGGALALALVHDLLDACSLRHSLFVFRAESRQPRAYRYEGRAALAQRLRLHPRPSEPALLALLRSADASSGSESASSDGSPRRARSASASPPAAASPPPPAASDSTHTSYVELRPYSAAVENMLDTPRLPEPRTDRSNETEQRADHSTSERSKSTTLSAVPSLSLKERESPRDQTSQEQEPMRSDRDVGEYSYDFPTSQESNNNEAAETEAARGSGQDEEPQVREGRGAGDSHSSVSLSDVAELVSERSSSLEQHSTPSKSPERPPSLDTSPLKISLRASNRLTSDDSGDHSSSPVPSLSNLSLDVHSD